MTQEKLQEIFMIEKLYVKDVSLEIPNAPKIFLNKTQPSIELKLTFATTNIDDSLYNTILNITVDAKVDQNQLYLIELQYAGIFQIKNIAENSIEFIKEVEIPNILYPYAREVLSDLIFKGGFQPILLPPTNFVQIYHNKKNSQNNATNNKSIN